MTNEQAKLEAIKKSWGNLWEQLCDNGKKYALENNGLSTPYYFNAKDPNDFTMGGKSANYFDCINSTDIDLEYFGIPTHSLVPKSLLPIENNNGWIRIEPDGSNLPNNSLDCKMIVSGLKGIKIGWFDTFLSKEKPTFLYKENKQIWEYKNVTHYKPIEVELMPIY